MAKRSRLFSRKTSPWAIAVVILFIVLGQTLGWFDSPQPTTDTHDPNHYKVTRFVDGDTIVIDLNGKQEAVRMIGVDTPETHAPNTPVQCYGPAASAYTKNLIGEQKVRLEKDPANDNRDRYGRLLRYVYLQDGRLIAKELIGNGYGFAYTVFSFTKEAEFVAAETQADEADRGLWGNCTITAKNGRKQTNDAN